MFCEARDEPKNFPDSGHGNGGFEILNIQRLYFKIDTVCALMSIDFLGCRNVLLSQFFLPTS